MKNGNHTHYCPICKEDWTCPRITHCQEPDVVICLFTSHTREQLEEFAKKVE